MADNPFGIRLADCMEALDGLGAGSVGLVLTDPPYGITARNPWDVKPDLDALWPKLLRACREDAAILVFSSGMFTAELMTSAPKGLWRYNLVWHKTEPVGFLNANRMPLRAHEDICVFYRRLPRYTPVKEGGYPRKRAKGSQSRRRSTNYGRVGELSEYDSTERYPTSVLTYATDKQKGEWGRLHPTQKPLALCRRLVEMYSGEGDLVLDPFMGSGTTGEAALSLGRRFAGFEADRGYFELARGRLAAASGEPTGRR